ncbi:GNAT family N-acetyltransferase [soil metagenome]
MDLDLRPIAEEEFPAYSRTIEAAFGMHGTDQDTEDWRLVFERDRSLAVFDGSEIVGTNGAFSFDLTLPGGTTTPVAGVTAVTVRTTHRRRGLLRALMDRQLDDVAARGEALAVLTASESIIYGRFGYGLASTGTFWRLPTQGTELTRRPTPGGRLRMVDKEDATRAIPAVYERARSRHPGALSRSAAFWQRLFLDRESWRDGATALFYFVHEAPSREPDGYVAFRRKGNWSHGLPDSTIIVEELDATNDEVEAALWQYLLDVDLVRTIRAKARPVDEALRWRLADPRSLAVTDAVDHLWARIVDVPAALGARRYGCDGSLVLQLADAFRPANEGRYRLEGGPNGATCARTDAEADLALDITDLGALYLGGVQPTALGRAGRVEERTPGALGRADALFLSSPAPWCCTEF